MYTKMFYMMLSIIVVLSITIGFILKWKGYPVYPGVIHKAVVYNRALTEKEVYESYIKDEFLPGFAVLSLSVKEIPKKGETIEMK